MSVGRVLSADIAVRLGPDSTRRINKHFVMLSDGYDSALVDIAYMSVSIFKNNPPRINIFTKV